MSKKLYLCGKLCSIACLSFFFFFFLLASSAQAHIYSFIDEAEKEDETCVLYHYRIAAWSSESDQLSNPCYKTQSCLLGVAHVHNADGTGDHWADGGDSVFDRLHIENMETIGDIRKAVLKSHPFPISSRDEHCGITKINECVGLMYYNGGILRLLPSSVCGIAPPPTGHCKFDKNSIELDYGSVSPADLNGRKVSATVSVNCDNNMNLEAYLINPLDGSDTVNLRNDGSVKAKMTLDGQNAANTGKAFSVSAGSRVPLTVTSEALVSGTPAAGEFSGSAVLFLSVP